MDVLILSFNAYFSLFYYSTVTTLAKFLGLSTSLLRSSAKSLANNWNMTILAISSISFLPSGIKMISSNTFVFNLSLVTRIILAFLDSHYFRLLTIFVLSFSSKLKPITTVLSSIRAIGPCLISPPI